VADAAIFAADAMDHFFARLTEDVPDLVTDGAKFIDMLQNIDDAEKQAAIREAIKPLVGDMFVTPKEIGEVIGWLAAMIANAINISMHEGIDIDDINRFMY